VHLDAGRLLLAEFEPDGSHDRIFTIVNHLNIGSSPITSAGERLSLARQRDLDRFVREFTS